MHVRVRIFGKPDTIVVVESKLTKIEKFRQILQDKFNVKQSLQRLFYGGKLLENGYTFHDYNIKLNDVIQLIVSVQASPEKEEIELKAGGEKKEVKVEYKDAKSMLYAIGDFIDMRDKEQGAWFEGKVIRIVHDPDVSNNTNSHKEGTQNKENNPENKQSEINEVKQKFFGKTSKWRKLSEKNENAEIKTDANLLYQVQIEGDEYNSKVYCKVEELRPRARTIIEVKELKIGRKVMLNYNPEQPHEKGYWYDFKVNEIVKNLRNTLLIGTVYLGPDAVPQNDTKVGLHDKIFAIEEVIPLEKRTEEYKELMKTQPEKRSCPLNCLTCRDDENAPCKDCGCYLCSGKEFPEKIVLCDECNKGYHMACLEPPITELPDEDWYCPDCKRDPNDVIAPGAAKQTKKRQTKSNRDWGRGMACVGKTKTCWMPPNHFGPIPGIEVGMCWRFRIQLSESGVHRPPVSGIHGRDVEGAYSIVLSGGYEDDVDYGYEFTYTGSGGRDLSGNKRTAEQSCDQTLTRENKALARNCAVKRVCEEGDDAGDEWREGRPVRVVRSYKMIKHFPKYAPKEGIRYDGIYKVVKYYPEKGISGYRVWKYLLRRDDPTPAPWEPDAKQFNIIYPDGYLEAEAEKKALKEKNSKGVKGPKGPKPKKRALRENSHCTDEEFSPPAKEQKSIKAKSVTPKIDVTKRKGRPPKNKSPAKSPETPKNSILNMLKRSPKPKSPNSGSDKNGNDLPTSDSEKPARGTSLSAEAIEIINADTLNSKLWQECLDVCLKRGKKYPDGYLEAEAEKKALKEKNSKGVKGPKGPKPKKRALRENSHSTDEEFSPPAKKQKSIKAKSVTPKIDVTKRKGRPPKNKSPAKNPETPKNSILNMLKRSPKSKSPNSGSDKNGNDLPTSDSEKPARGTSLSAEAIEIINADTLNSKLWQECLDVCLKQGKKEFVEHVSQVFLCIICQEVAVSPTTTPCLHNFCMACIKQAFKATGCQTCPCCRHKFSKYEPEPNEQLKAALRQVMAGYDAGKK